MAKTISATQAARNFRALLNEIEDTARHFTSNDMGAWSLDCGLSVLLARVSLDAIWPS